MNNFKKYHKLIFHLSCIVLAILIHFIPLNKPNNIAYNFSIFKKLILLAIVIIPFLYLVFLLIVRFIIQNTKIITQYSLIPSLLFLGQSIIYLYYESGIPIDMNIRVDLLYIFPVLFISGLFFTVMGIILLKKEKRLEKLSKK